MADTVLFCDDGSKGSEEALRIAAGLIDSERSAVVLTTWEPTAEVLARSAPFGPIAVADSAEAEADATQEKGAKDAAAAGAERVRAAGLEASDRVERTIDGAVATILRVADELDASLIVCGRRGRGPVTSAILGSVSEGLLMNSTRPILVVPAG